MLPGMPHSWFYSWVAAIISFCVNLSRAWLVVIGEVATKLVLPTFDNPRGLPEATSVEDEGSSLRVG